MKKENEKYETNMRAVREPLKDWMTISIFLSLPLCFTKTFPMFDSFKFLFEIFFVCSAFSSVSGTVKVKLMSRSLALKNFEILIFFDRFKLEFNL